MESKYIKLTKNFSFLKVLQQVQIYNNSDMSFMFSILY